jgi:hypothetical protein
LRAKPLLLHSEVAEFNAVGANANGEVVREERARPVSNHGNEGEHYEH